MGAPSHPDDVCEQVAALLRDAAIERLEAAAAALGDQGPAIALRAELLRRRRRHDEAAPLFAAAIEANPDLLPAYHCAALNAVARGDRAGARATWTALLERSPDDALARYHIGLTHHDEGHFGAAAEWYQRQLAREPGSFNAAYNLGLVRMEQGDAAGAIAALAVAATNRPGEARAWTALGRARRRVGDLVAAAEAYLRAHALAPTDARPLVDAADALADAAELPAAIELLDRAIALAPDDASLRWRAGSHLGNLGVHDRALMRMREALALNPDDARGHSAVLLHMQYDTSLATRAEVARAHWEWGDRHARGLPRPDVPRQPRPPGAPLRIGYLSPRFGHGPLASFFLPVLEAHDSARYHVTLYSAYRHDDEIAARMRRAAAAWRDLPTNDEAAAALIAADGLDLLVDLAGHAPGHRLAVLARKPAPVQACWLDYFETTGVDAIDYFVSDATHTPEGESVHFRERLVRLPHCRFAYRSVVPTPPTPAPSRARGYVTFGTFNRHAKITATALALWRDVLAAVPSSRIELRASAYRGAGTVDWVKQRWAAAGMPIHRIDFRPYVPLAEAIGAYRNVDVALDTFPYNGGVTTCDALSMGVPVIALEGDRMIARQSAALLRAAGHPEWIAGDHREFLALAVSVAREVERGGIRAALHDEFPRSRLGDVPAFTAALERAWITLVELGPRDDGARRPPVEIPG